MRDYYRGERTVISELREEVKKLDTQLRRTKEKIVRKKTDLSGMPDEAVKQHKREQAQGYRRKVKKAVFDHYGQVCYCCNETAEPLLTIDHIRGDGWYMRKHAKHKETWKWAVVNNFPNTIRISCWNCNVGRAYNNGVCPHKTHPVSPLYALLAKN